MIKEKFQYFHDMYGSEEPIYMEMFDVAYDQARDGERSSRNLYKYAHRLMNAIRSSQESKLYSMDSEIRDLKEEFKTAGESLFCS